MILATILSLGIFLIGAFIINSFKNIPVRHVGQLKKWGKRISGKFLKEGWHFLPFRPLWYDVILIDVGKIPFEVVVEKATTPDKASSKVPVEIVYIPIQDHLVEYINSGEKAGAITQFTSKTIERIREWCSDEEGGPANWWELNQSRLEGVSVLITKLARNSVTELPSYAQDVPTWIWLRYYSKPRPKKFRINEKMWAENNWKAVTDVLDKIKNDLGQQAITNLEGKIAQRRDEVLSLMTGSGNIVMEDLGIRITRLNIKDVDVLGETGKQAEQAAKEEEERRAEDIELDHVENQIKKFTNIGYSKAEAKEIVQTERGKVPKTIVENKITMSQETGDVLEKIAGTIFKK